MTNISSQLADIRQTILTHLGSFLGTYTRTDGSKVPAIQLTPKKIPDNWSITGIECVIEDPLEMKPNKLLNKYVSISREITIRFIQHDPNKTLRELREKAMVVFCKYEDVTSPMYTLPQGLVILEEVTYRITISSLQKLI